VGKAVAQPERILGQYDIVFAKAKAAIEAMSVGCAVVLCDAAGTGPMVTPANFHALRPLNFGQQAIEGPLCADNLMQEIRRYDVDEAAQVRNLVRNEAKLSDAVTQLLGIYDACIANSSADVRTAPQLRRELLRRRLATRAYFQLSRCLQRLPAKTRQSIKATLTGSKAHKFWRRIADAL
jgi:hypothetical protein